MSQHVRLAESQILRRELKPGRSGRQTVGGRRIAIDQMLLPRLTDVAFDFRLHAKSSFSATPTVDLGRGFLWSQGREAEVIKHDKQQKSKHGAGHEVCSLMDGSSGHYVGGPEA